MVPHIQRHLKNQQDKREKGPSEEALALIDSLTWT